MMNNFSKRLYGLADLLLQSPCPLCGRVNARSFCRDCQRQIQRCQFSSPAWEHHAVLPIFAWGRYSEALRRAIAAFKYNNKPQLSQPFGQWLADAWSSAANRATDVIVVPIPMHVLKRQQRGFNQAELLAEQFCDQTQLPLQRHGLERSRETTAQFQLSASDRAQNLADAFNLGADFRKCPPTKAVVLLDDIYTTGATARSAAQTLRRHGIRVQGLIVLAKAEKEGGRRGKQRRQGEQEEREEF
ncbi:MAG: ComF family protein [Leptolyngbya sp. BL-A-14]